MENPAVPKVNYLCHSGFAVETENHLLIFDYYRDSVDSGEKKIANGAVGAEDLKTGKSIYVFASHSHSDHFNPAIFKWKAVNKDIRYVLSSDIKTRHADGSLRFISAYEEASFGGLSVKAYGSTDIGVSFLVKVDGISLFHSGDLNWWCWEDSREEMEKAENWFKEEIAKLEGQSIDIAFFPVDPRLEDGYFKGGEYFISKLKPKAFIPMHFWENYGITGLFAAKVKGCPARVLEITHRGQQLLP